MKERRRERFEAQLLEVREELRRLGVSEQAQSANHSTSVTSNQTSTPSRQKPARELMAAAYELAGYVVATLALKRSIPPEIVVEENAKYDLGRCSASDLDTIWAVGHLAVEHSRNEGSTGEAGLVAISVKVEAAVAGEMEEQNPEAILEKNWSEIARVARMLFNRGKLTREEIETEVFEADEMKIEGNAPRKYVGLTAEKTRDC
jgi:hypothetical protein